jgi:hypothetical protein
LALRRRMTNTLRGGQKHVTTLKRANEAFKDGSLGKTIETFDG